MSDGGDPLLQLIVDRWGESGVGTNAGVTLTHAATETYSHIVTGVQVSGDLAALVTLQSPSGTTLWRMRYAAAFDRSYTFPLGVIQGAFSKAVLLVVSASTANCEANMQGFTVETGTLSRLATDAAERAFMLG
jgi:hypothetical protein